MSEPTPEASVLEAATRPADTILLDVRELDEWAAGHAPGAVHVPLGVLHPNVVAGDSAVLCVCRSGRRSATATARLRAAGIDATNVTGGMNAWAEAGLAIIRDDGQPGTVA